MYICLYTNKECETANKDGECRKGQQNCSLEDLMKIDGFYKELQELNNNSNPIKLLEEVKEKVKSKHIARDCEYDEGYTHALWDIEDIIDNMIKELGGNG